VAVGEAVAVSVAGRAVAVGAGVRVAGRMALGLAEGTGSSGSALRAGPIRSRAASIVIVAAMITSRDQRPGVGRCGVVIARIYDASCMPKVPAFSD